MEFNINQINQRLPLHCMVDLETYDSRPTAQIISIGACMFDKEGIESKFYIVVDQKSSEAAGLTSSQSTVDWWSKQSAEARIILADETPKVSLTDGLTAFGRWFLAAGGKFMWGNGADFDNAILAVAYDKCDIDLPWRYSNNRCFRTIKNGKYITARKGTYHNALDDAITQAQYMVDNKLVPL